MLLIVLLLLAVAGCGNPTEETPAPVPAFETPTPLGAPIATAGWEDSGFISPDGRFFYFTYLRIDPIALVQTGAVRIIGPLRPGWDPADTIAAKLYRAEFSNGSWAEPQNLGAPINIPGGLQGDEWVSADGNRILFTDPAGRPGRPVPAIYYAEKANGAWQTPVLAASAGFPFVPGDENPHLTLDEQTLFFESSRPGGFGGPDLWWSVRQGNGWSQPVNLGATINTSGTEGSPFSFDGTELYFDDKGSGNGISWTRKSAAGWRTPVVVIRGTWGDPSLTTAGDLFLIGVGPDQSNGPHADPFVARRRPAI